MPLPGHYLGLPAMPGSFHDRSLLSTETAQPYLCSFCKKKHPVRQDTGAAYHFYSPSLRLHPAAQTVMKE